MNAFLAASLVKATLLLLVTALVLRMSARASAASRHVVALLGLGSALAVPVLGLLLPRWEIPLIPARVASAPASSRALPGDSPAAGPLAGFTGPVGVQVPPLTEAAAEPSRRASASFGVDAAKVATTLWILGALVPLVALAIGFRRAAALVRNARPAEDPDLVALAKEISERLAIGRVVPVLLSAEVTIPMTAGLVRPVLLLPESARAWPRERQRVVLLHELAHVARRDLGALLVSEFATASYWFHPLAHFVAAQLRRSAEEASDDLVLGDGTRASDYASHLVGIVRGLGAPGASEAMPMLAMARPSDLEDRVRAILDPRRRRRAPSRFLTASMSAAGIAGALALAAVAPGVARPAMAETPAGTALAANRRESGSAAYSRGGRFHRDGRYLEAAEAYRKAVELGYREETAAYNAACAYARAGRKDDAFVWLNKSIELGFDVERYLRNDDDLDSLRKDPRFADLKKAARSAKAEGNEAASALRRFERLSADASKNGARWYEAGKELLDAERLEQSEKAFRMAASLGYRVGASTYNAACALARAGKVPQALDTLDAALEAGFDDPSLIERDDDLDALRDEPRLAQLKKKAEDLTLEVSDVESGISRLFRRRSAWREQVSHYAAYAKAHPGSGRAHYNLGYAQLLAERPDAALSAFTRALELGYRRPATLYNLACTHAQLREKDKAFGFLFQAIDAGYDSPDHIRHDEDLDPLRGDPRFRKALEQAKGRKSDADD